MITNCWTVSNKLMMERVLQMKVKETLCSRCTTRELILWILTYNVVTCVCLNLSKFLHISVVFLYRINTIASLYCSISRHSTKCIRCHEITCIRKSIWCKSFHFLGVWWSGWNACSNCEWNIISRYPLIFCQLQKALRICLFCLYTFCFVQ